MGYISPLPCLPFPQDKELILAHIDQVTVPGKRFNIDEVLNRPVGVRVTMRQPDWCVRAPEVWLPQLERYNSRPRVEEGYEFPTSHPVTGERLESFRHLAYKQELDNKNKPTGARIITFLLPTPVAHHICDGPGGGYVNTPAGYLMVFHRGAPLFAGNQIVVHTMPTTQKNKSGETSASAGHGAAPPAAASAVGTALALPLATPADGAGQVLPTN